MRASSEHIREVVEFGRWFRNFRVHMAVVVARFEVEVEDVVSIVRGAGGELDDRHELPAWRDICHSAPPNVGFVMNFRFFAGDYPMFRHCHIWYV